MNWRIAKLNWKKVLLIVFAAVSLAALYFAIHSSLHYMAKHPVPEVNPPEQRPAHSQFFWENDEKFLKLRARYQTPVRMAAFQTTLPDPLPGEEYNVGLAAEMLKGTVVQREGIFSMNQTLGPRTRERGFREGPAYAGGRVIRVIGGGICKISTTLYNVAVLANLEIMERRPHGMLVPYVPPGQDATVSYGTTDFKFRNTSGQPIMIWAEKRNTTLYMVFYGRAPAPRVIWHHRVLSRREMPVIRRYNSRLPAGEEKIVQPGAEGMKIKNWVMISRANGKTERKELGIDHYQPMPQIIESGK